MAKVPRAGGMALVACNAVQRIFGVLKRCPCPCRNGQAGRIQLRTRAHHPRIGKHAVTRYVTCGSRSYPSPPSDDHYIVLVSCCCLANLNTSFLSFLFSAFSFFSTSSPYPQTSSNPASSYPHTTYTHQTCPTGKTAAPCSRPARLSTSPANPSNLVAPLQMRSSRRH